MPRNPLDVLAQQIVAMCAMRRVARRRPARARPPRRAVRHAAAVGVRRGARHARRPLPQRRVRRAAAAPGVGPRDRHAHRPPRRAAARGHQRRHHPRPRAVRRLPRRREGVPRRRARRGDGLRVARRRRVRARLLELADRGHHPRPRARLARARASPAGCRSGTATPSAARTSSAARSARFVREVVGADARRPRRSGSPRPASTSCAAHQPARLPRRAARGHRPRARRPHDRGRAVPRRARRLADRGALAVRRAGARAVGARDRRAAARAVRRRRAGDARRRRHRAAAARRRGRRRSCAACSSRRCSTPTRSRQLVTAEVGGSALFAARFRECAARALLLPRRNPGKRSPLWQQRQRSAQLLQVASQYGSFPIVLETMREVLQDVYDVPGLVALMRSVAAREVRVVEVETPTPSPFARSLLFGYVAQFLYEGDSPLAERRAAALTPRLHAARRAARPGRAARPARRRGARAGRGELQRLTPERRARDVEGVADLLRMLGPLTLDAAVARGVEPAPGSTELVAARRVIVVRMAGGERVTPPSRTPRGCATRWAPRCRSGCPTRSSSPSPTRSATSSRATRARTGRSTSPTSRPRSGSAPPSSSGALARLAAAGRVVSGEFRPGGSGTEWCDAEVLRLVRRRSLAALRREVEPVPAGDAGRVPARRGSTSGSAARLRGVDGVLRVVEQLAGVVVPASALGDRSCCPRASRATSPRCSTS